MGVHNKPLFLCVSVYVHASEDSPVHCTNTSLVMPLPHQPSQQHFSLTHTDKAPQTVHTLSSSKNTVAGGGNGVTWSCSCSTPMHCSKHAHVIYCILQWDVLRGFNCHLGSLHTPARVKAKVHANKLLLLARKALNIWINTIVNISCSNRHLSLFTIPLLTGRENTAQRKEKNPDTHAQCYTRVSEKQEMRKLDCTDLSAPRIFIFSTECSWQEVRQCLEK